MRQRVMGLVVFAVSSILFLAAGELLMQLYLPARYYVWPPNFQHSFRPPPEVIHGVSSPAQLTINAFGLRGDPLSDDEQYRLLTVGASTTICVYLDDAKVWPYLVQQRLNDVLGPETVWVGNAGRPGHSTPQHLLQVEKLLEQYPEIDAVVLLIGIADLLVDLSATIDAPPVFEEGTDGALRRAFSIFPDWDAESPWYTRNVIGRAVRLRNWHPLPIERDGVFAMDEQADFVKMIREFRAAASLFRQTPPDLSKQLAVYVRNLDAIVEAAREADRRVIFLTQPALWKPGMSQAERALLWGGGTDFFHAGRGKEYYSEEVLADAMRLYNDALLEVCQKRGAECVDMASALPRTTKVFYDDAHFTEFGAAMLADRLAEYLLATEPLNQMRSSEH
jgi:lysophospholipase L1-like esterase